MAGVRSDLSRGLRLVEEGSGRLAGALYEIQNRDPSLRSLARRAQDSLDKAKKALFQLERELTKRGIRSARRRRRRSR